MLKKFRNVDLSLFRLLMSELAAVQTVEARVARAQAQRELMKKT